MGRERSLHDEGCPLPGGAMVKHTWDRGRRLACAFVAVLALFGTYALHMVGINGLAPLSAAAQPAEGQSQADLEQEAEEARRAMELFLRREKLLFRQGEFSLEFDAFYSTDSREDFMRLNNSRELAEVTTRLVGWSAIARYGLIDKLELDLAIPFGYAEQQVDFGFATARTDDFGLGDIAGRLRYQLWEERGARPDVILDLDVKSRSAGDSLLGSGHWSVGGSIALVKTLDPVVFFGRLGYIGTLERDGRDPGDAVIYELGMGFSLNDRVSFSMRVDGAVVGRLETDGDEIPGSSLDIMNLQFLVTTRLSRNWFIEPTVSIGLTEDAPDVVAGLNLIYRFWRRQL
jgi:Putative MetA-pathway of phenol degradation